MRASEHGLGVLHLALDLVCRDIVGAAVLVDAHDHVAEGIHAVVVLFDRFLGADGAVAVALPKVAVKLLHRRIWLVRNAEFFVYLERAAAKELDPWPRVLPALRVERVL